MITMISMTNIITIINTLIVSITAVTISNN